MIDVVDLLAPRGRGPVYGAATEDLNLTLLSWEAGARVPAHVNEERDVAYVVVSGSGSLTVDGVTEALVAPAAVVVAKGAMRQLVAGADGIRYVTVHRARGGLQIRRF